MGVTPALDLAPRPPAGRAGAAGAAGAACGLVLLLLLVVDLPAAVRFPLLVAHLALALGVARAVAGAARGRHLHWSADGSWTVDGRPARLAAATRVYAGLVVLHWVERDARPCRIARGDLPAAEFRRLRTRLRLDAEPRAGTADPAAGSP